MGAFLVLEASEHAHARGAKPLARLATVVNARSNREPGAVTATLAELWKTLPAIRPDCAVISGASGAGPATAEERTFLDTHPELAVRATGSRIGHGVEPQFPMNIALAAIAVERRALFAPGDPSEQAATGALTQAVVTGIGHWRGEGLAVVEAAE
jgi:3-oxoacyl-[acyl-carrier-protein] synthase II